MKRILALVLAFCMLVPMVSFAETSEVSYAGSNEAYNVYIEGVATSSSVSIMLKRQDNSVAYISQLKPDENNGKYVLKFKFTGDIQDCSAYVRDEDTGLDISETVKTAVATSVLYSASLNVAVDGEDRAYIKADDALKVSVDIKNKYGDDDSMVVLVAAYGANNKLLATKITSVDVLYEDLSATKNVNLSGFTIPEKTVKAKVFAWSDIETMIPVASPQSLENQEIAKNDITSLVMHPGSDATERRFTWYNSSKTAGAKLQYALKSDYEKDGGFTDSNSVEVVGTTEAPPKNTTSLSCKANITDLTPGAEYVYRVGHESLYDDTVYSFKTYDHANADKQTFIMVSDIHVDSYDQVTAVEEFDESTYKPGAAEDSKYIQRYKNVFDSIKLQNPDAEFIASTGDNVSQACMGYLSKKFYNSWEVSRQHAELEMEILFAQEIMKEIPWASTLGNHESESSSSAGYPSVAKWHYNLPNDDGITGTIVSVANGSVPYTHGNFWFRNGDVLVVGINAVNNTTSPFANTLYDDNAAFIKKAIEDNEDANWRILINHVPAYAFTGKFQESANLRKRFADMEIDQYDFDVVFSGHQHSYSRSKQLLSDWNDDKTNTCTYTDITGDEPVEKEFIVPEVVSEDKIVHKDDGNGWQIDTVTDPEGTVHIDLPRLYGVEHDPAVPDYNQFIEAMITRGGHTYVHTDETVADERIKTYGALGSAYMRVTVEKTETGEQMKLELVLSGATATSTSNTGTVLDTYIINKTR